MTRRIEVLVSPEEFAAVAEEWAILAARDPHATAFGHPAVLSAIASLLDLDGEPIVVTARAANGRLLAVLPLRVQVSEGGFRSRVAVPFLSWHGSYADAVVSPGEDAALEEAVLTVTRTPVCEGLALKFVLAGSPLARATTGLPGREDGMAQVVRPADATGLGESGPQEIPRKRRRYLHSGRARVTTAEPAAAIADVLARFAALHSTRWQDDPAATEFQDPAVQARFAVSVAPLVADGICRIGTLRLGEEIVAVHIAFRWQAREYAWRIAHDPAHRTMSPGRLLYACMIEAAFAEGCTEYHLGRGDEGYKADWNPHAVPLHRTDWTLRRWHRVIRRLARLARAW